MDSVSEIQKGTKGKFFHPMTFGVMYSGVVVEVCEDGMVIVKFDVDKKKHKTFPDHNK